MDRQPHDYAAAMVYAQQQQIAANVQQQQPFGFHPQPQQFPQQMHHPSFVPPHLSQQFRHLPPPQQLRPAPHHLPFHLQQQQHQQQPPPFQPHLPPHLLPPPYLQPFESAPTPPVAPPSDSELHKRIDKLVEYASKNGPEFELMIREKQKDNPEYAFLFGAEGHNYYRYKLWLSTHSSGTAFSSSYPHPSMSAISHPHTVMVNSLNAGVGGVPPSMYSGSQMHQPPPQPFYDHQIQQHSLPFMGQPRSDYESPVRPFKGLAGPLPSDVAAELNTVLNNLNGSKESIKGAKTWFMQRSPFAPALAEALRDRVFNLEDSDRQMHIIYLANDILFDSLQRRASPHDLDNEALAFRPVLGSMLARIYSNPHNKDANQSRLQKILQFWTSNEVYDADSTKLLEGEMMGGPAPPGHSKDFSTDPSVFQQMSPNLIHWQLDNQRSHAGSLDPDQHEKQASLATPGTSSSSQMGSSLSHPFSRNASTSNIYPPMNSTPLTVTVQTVPSSQPASTANVGDQPVPPYPLFPPGLIPGMVRKMQIGSGVPYSPLSPLDIPTVIPPTTASPSEILERVSKFFKEIGEVNPSEGPMKSPGSNDDDYEYEREPPVRKGGACIPPPSNLQVDPDTGTYPDGTVERKPGSSTSGRLGLGATANPNEVSQYDDVYSSYRKQRSTNYHSSMSARSAAR